MSNGDLEQLLRLVDEYQLGEEDELRRLLQVAPFVENDVVAEELSRVVEAKVAERHLDPFDTDRQVRGRLRLGETRSGEKFSVDGGDLSRHLLAVGQSGAGKTTLFYNIMGQLEVPFWSFDLKQDYRHLAEEEELLVLPWTKLRFNPLRPPSGVSPKRWAQVFSEIFSHATALLSGSKNYLLKSVIELYRQYGLFDCLEPPFPSLHELELVVSNEGINYVRKSSDYRDTLLNRLEAMNLVAGKIFDCSSGYRLEELLDRDVVFEFDGLNRDVQNFLMEVLFAYVYEYRVAQNHRDEGLNHVFFLDEGKRVFSVYKERQDASGIPEIDELTAKMREFGEGLVVADQEASKLTDSIKANTYTKVLLATGDRRQFEAVADSMNLSERQTEVASQLGVGEAVVQVGNRGPVPVKLDDHQLEKTVTDEKLRSLQAENWNQLQYEPRERLPEFDLLQQDGEKEIVEDPPAELNFSSEADRLLEDVVENPFEPLTGRYDLFSSSYKGNKAKDELVDAGAVIERNVRYDQGKRKLLELTEQGRSYVEDTLDLEVKRRGRGGIKHRYWQKQIQEMFEAAGWAAERELFDADVYVNMGSLELAVEVAMGNNPREVEHVEKHLDKFAAVWIASPNQDVQDGLKQRLAEQGIESEGVVFRLFREFDGEELPAG